MQNSLSKFHHLSFQSSKFGFYHFNPLNFIFFSIKFFVHHPLLATVIFSCYSFITFHLQLFLKKNKKKTFSPTASVSTWFYVFSLFPPLDLSSPSFPLSISLSFPFPPLSPS